jgi:cysteine synthase
VTRFTRRHQEIGTGIMTELQRDVRQSIGNTSLLPLRKVGGFVESVGTAASVRGTGEAFGRHHKRTRIVAVEPSESPAQSGGQAGAHKIDGVGAGFEVPLWHDADSSLNLSRDPANYEQQNSVLESE